MGFIEGATFGAIGGLIVEIYGLYQLRKRSKSQMPAWIKSPFYWLVTIAMIAVGAGVVVFYLHSGATLIPLAALHLGAATPTLIGMFSKSATETGVAG